MNILTLMSSIKLTDSRRIIAEWTLVIWIVCLAAISIGTLFDTAILSPPLVCGAVVSCNGNPMKNAHIQLSDRRTITGIGGLFEFKNVDPDRSKKELIIRVDNKIVAESIVEVRRGRNVLVHVVLDQKAFTSLR